MTGLNNKYQDINFPNGISKIFTDQKTLESDKVIFNKIEILREKTSNLTIFNIHPDKKSTAELIKKDSTPPKWGRFLYKIIKLYNFKSCLELGTCLGFSSAYIASALSPTGKLISIEGLEDRAQIAKNNLNSLKLNNFNILTGQFSKVLPNILIKNKFDFVYIDGHHKEKATLRYFDMIYPRLLNNSMIIIDDIHWPIEMKPAWEKIKQDKRIFQTYTIDKWGICLINNN